MTVISAEAVTFPDGSLGCPQPGMVYTQALVDGYKIVAEAGGKTYDYRGTGSTFRLCSRPRRLAGRTSGGRAAGLGRLGRGRRNVHLDSGWSVSMAGAMGSTEAGSGIGLS